MAVNVNYTEENSRSILFTSAHDSITGAVCV
jgi:hypothetical protein